MSFTTGNALKYTLLPGIIPRIRDFFASGFSSIALYMAYVYRGVRLLPAGHPYLNPANLGKFGIRHVVFEARRNLVFKKENIDQIIIFFALIAGIVLILVQFSFLILSLLTPLALAGGLGDEIQDYTNIANFFTIPNPTYDIAFRLLDLTFGFENPYAIYNSCAVQGVQCQLAFAPGTGAPTPVGPVYDVPTPFHLALHSLFHFYNMGVLVVAFMIGGYMFVTIVGETAQTGTPFGKRFNGMWAPIRLVVAIALLTPLSFGMNGAQLLTLVIAKWGSNLATNGWSEFMFDLQYLPIQGGLQAPPTLVARPNAPPVGSIVEFVFVAQVCEYMEFFVNRRGNGKGPRIEAYQVFSNVDGDPQQAVFRNLTFAQALANARNQDIVLRFGIIDEINYSRLSGNVKPICGELIFHTRSLDNVASVGAYEMQEFYFELVQELWDDVPNLIRAENIALRYTPTAEKDPNAAPLLTTEYVAATIEWFDVEVFNAINAARQAQINATWTNDYTLLGWAGAAIWYQTIAEYTGSLYASVNGIPTANLYPEVMEEVKEQRRIHNDFVEGGERYSPVLASGKVIEWSDGRNLNMATAYYYAQQQWDISTIPSESNIFVDSITSVFGLNGLLSMPNQVDVHPLAQLVGVGRSLIESALNNFGFSFLGGVGGGIAKALGRDLVGSVAISASVVAAQIAIIGLSIGFILFYILPFLPFLYFFFAAGGWLKSIFEAMVGLPLWAMAHIRIDGEGLPGPAAMNGYFLIFAIFIKPILIIFGLLASIAIFTAQVQILNEIWQLVTSNATGFNTDQAKTAAAQVAAGGTGAGAGAPLGSIQWLRSRADEFFFTVIYAVIVYMMAMASFKLIDLIPANILRWMGSSVNTLSEQGGDPASGLVRYSFIGSQMAMGPINQGLQSIAQRAGPRV